MVISHRAPAQCKFFTSHQSPVTSHEIQLYFSRGRKGSGDLPGLQSRRFGPSRVEWWIRLPHASAKLLVHQERREDPPFAEPARDDWIRAKAPFGSRVCFCLEDRSYR